MFAILLAFLVALLIVGAFLHSYLLWRSWPFPGPFPWPIIGSSLPLIRGRLEFHQFAAQLIQTYGDDCCASILGRTVVILSSQRAIDHVTNGRTRAKYVMKAGDSQRENLEMIGMYRTGLLLNDDVAAWKRGRQMFVRALSPAYLRSSLDKTNECVLAFERYVQDSVLQGAAVGVIEDLTVRMREITLSTILKTAFSMEITRDSSECRQMIAGVSEFFAALMFFRSNVITWIWKWFKASEAARHRASVLRLHDEVNKLIAQRAEELGPLLHELEKFRTDDGDIDVGRLQRHSDFLSSLLLLRDHESGGRSLSHELVRQLIQEMIGGGTDTASLTLTYALLYLAEYPDVQTRVAAEALAVLGPDRQPTFEDVSTGLPYALSVVKEVLRVRPLVPQTSRMATEDDELWDGIVIRAETQLFFNWEARMQDSREWGPDAKRFDPDRWLPERERPANKTSWLPFGGGVKMCPGYQLALVEIVCVLAQLVRRFSFEQQGGVTVSSVPKRQLTVVTPIVPVPIRVRLREIVALSRKPSQ